MKNRIFLTRAVISTFLSFSFLIFPFRLRASIAAPVAPIKTESQYRAEASRYDAAVRAIAGILTMKLETSDDLKAALNIVEQQRQYLKFFRSKLVVLGLSNSTFAAAIKRKIPTKDAANAFLTSISADRNKVTTIAGFDELQTQFKKSAEADAAVLRRASERLKIAGEKLKAAERRPASSDLRFVNTSYTSPAETSAHASPQDPVTIIGVVFIVAVVFIVVTYGAAIISNASTEEGRDLVAECQARADENYARCAAAADFFGKLGCAATLLAEQALCIVFPEQVR